jgi:hypothetical protein
MIGKGKKRIVTISLGVIGAIALVFFVASWEIDANSVSSDGTLQARVLGPSPLGHLFYWAFHGNISNPTAYLQVVDYTSHEQVIADEQNAGALLNEYLDPADIFWAQDGTSFIYVYTINPPGATYVSEYKVERNPLRVDKKVYGIYQQVSPYIDPYLESKEPKIRARAERAMTLLKENGYQL